jgi:Tfp pilus assembly protein FimV
MAIAALPEIPSGDDACEIPWPRPVLRLVAPPLASPPVIEEPPAQAVCTGRDVSERRRVRASARVRRRRVLTGLLVAGVLGVLALPTSALAGRPAVAHRVAAPTGGSTYLVQPGDTLWSIASRVDRSGDPRALVRELAAETGSETVYPGERIALP